MKGSDQVVVDALCSATSLDRVRVGSTELGLYRRDASNLDGDAGVVCIDRAESRHPVRLQIELGQTTPTHVGSAGRVLLSA